MNQPETGKFLAVLALAWAFGIVALTGCDESQDRRASRKSGSSVNTSQRLIRASQESLPLTESEVNQAAQADSSQQQERLSQQVAQRWAEVADPAESNKLMEQLNQLSAKVTSDASADSLSAYYSGLMATTQSLLAQQQALGNLAARQSKDKLDSAEKILTDALKFAKAGGDRSAQIAPQLTLGTLNLIRARDGNGRLCQSRLDVQTIKVAINYLAGAIMRQDAIISATKALQPQRTIAQLKTELSRLQLQLEQTQKNLGQLQTKQDQTRLKLDENSQKAYQIHQNYLQIMQKSDQIIGQQRYVLRQEAYDLRIGTDDPQLPGSLYYEAQAELAQNDLDIITEQVSFEQLRHQQLTQNVEGISLTIQQLQSAPATTTDLNNALQDSEKEKTRLAASLTLQLEQLNTAETAYAQGRVDVVDAYRKAIDAFDAASGNAAAADRRSTTAKYADSLKLIAGNELAQLWLNDADFYQSASAVLDLVGGVEETRQAVGTMSQNYKNQAQQAQASAAELEDKK